MAEFKDHFSPQAGSYAKFRPSYPNELYAWLAEQVAQKDHAWDCATGSGQAAVALAQYFDQITATDASDSQLKNALAHPKVTYRTAPAEASGHADHSVDLVTVAQALHWFHFERFYAEVRRVLRPNGLLAVWSYGFYKTSPELDQLSEHYADGILGPYWPPERKIVDAGYQTISFPFQRISTPAFAMTAEWTFEHLMGYLTTWSSRKNYVQEHGNCPLEPLRKDFEAAWGDLNQTRTITWPLALLVGRV